MKALLTSAAFAALDMAAADASKIAAKDRRKPAPSEFATLGDLQAADRWAWKFMDSVRAGGRASLEPFFGFQPACAFIYAPPFFASRAPSHHAPVSAPMTEGDFAALIAAEVKRNRKGAKRQAVARRARIAKALASPANARARFEAKEAARRARSAGGPAL